MKSRIVVQCSYRYVGFYTVRVEPKRNEALDAIREMVWPDADKLCSEATGIYAAHYPR